ncbi:MAG: aminotransferase class V-fold PLP-dependent enzyme, partial [Gemmatimonadetes bacterium]|nr:aminotransferase class V-fold PLP-dependent enzyme [Gemmatimonadota bacterium]
MGDRAARDEGMDAPPLDPRDWESVRAQFAIADRPIDLSALYIASHPQPVRRAIAEHRAGLDQDPTLYLMRHNVGLTHASIRAAARHLSADDDDVALTDSTTMALGLLYNGLRLRPGDEILTTEHDYYVTHESLRQAAEGSGASVRKIPL